LVRNRHGVHPTHACYRRPRMAPFRRLVACTIAATLAVVAPRVTSAGNCSGTSTGDVPLPDLGSSNYPGQFEGGLYRGGANPPPATHLSAGLAAAAAVVPRNFAGNPDPTGKIVLLSVGMSNTTAEFCIPIEGTTGCTPESFMGQAAASSAVNHATLV